MVQFSSMLSVISQFLFDGASCAESSGELFRGYVRETHCASQELFPQQFLCSCQKLDFRRPATELLDLDIRLSGPSSWGFSTKQAPADNLERSDRGGKLGLSRRSTHRLRARTMHRCPSPPPSASARHADPWNGAGANHVEASRRNRRDPRANAKTEHCSMRGLLRRTNTSARYGADRSVVKRPRVVLHGLGAHIATRNSYAPRSGRCCKPCVHAAFAGNFCRHCVYAAFGLVVLPRNGVSKAACGFRS